MQIGDEIEAYRIYRSKRFCVLFRFAEFVASAACLGFAIVLMVDHLTLPQMVTLPVLIVSIIFVVITGSDLLAYHCQRQINCHKAWIAFALCGFVAFVVCGALILVELLNNFLLILLLTLIFSAVSAILFLFDLIHIFISKVCRHSKQATISVQVSDSDFQHAAMAADSELCPICRRIGKVQVPKTNKRNVQEELQLKPKTESIRQPALVEKKSKDYPTIEANSSYISKKPAYCSDESIRNDNFIAKTYKTEGTMYEEEDFICPQQLIDDKTEKDHSYSKPAESITKIFGQVRKSIDETPPLIKLVSKTMQTSDDIPEKTIEKEFDESSFQSTITSVETIDEIEQTVDKYEESADIIEPIPVETKCLKCSRQPENKPPEISEPVPLEQEIVQSPTELETVTIESIFVTSNQIMIVQPKIGTQEISTQYSNTGLQSDSEYWKSLNEQPGSQPPTPAPTPTPTPRNDENQQPYNFCEDPLNHLQYIQDMIQNCPICSNLYEAFPPFEVNKQYIDELYDCIPVQRNQTQETIKEEEIEEEIEQQLEIEIVKEAKVEEIIEDNEMTDFSCPKSVYKSDYQCNVVPMISMPDETDVESYIDTYRSLYKSCRIEEQTQCSCKNTSRIEGAFCANCRLIKRTSSDSPRDKPMNQRRTSAPPKIVSTFKTPRQSPKIKRDGLDHQQNRSQSSPIRVVHCKQVPPKPSPVFQIISPPPGRKNATDFPYKTAACNTRCYKSTASPQKVEVAPKTYRSEPERRTSCTCRENSNNPEMGRRLCRVHGTRINSSPAAAVQRYNQNIVYNSDRYNTTSP